MKLIVLALACTLLIGCKPKQQAQRQAQQQTSRNSRSEWNTATTLGAYEAHGRKNPAWDYDAKQCLIEYVKLRGGITNYEERLHAIELAGTYSSAAVKKGCDDPLIEYVFCRFGKYIPEDELKTRICRSADEMQRSQYAPVRKFFANLRASETLWKNRDTNVWARVAQYQAEAINNFVEMAQDKNTPIEEIDQTGNELIQTVAREDWALKMIIDGAEALLVQNWPEQDATYAIKAALYYNYAWRARGTGYANQVTDEGWKGFNERLKVATEAAEKGWSLNAKNTRIPTLMIKLAEVNQEPREEMERWFAKAMELEPNNYEACRCKLHYLYPQWYGSAEEMIKFGHECVESPVWTGTVPLIMVDAHEQIALYIQDKAKQKAYWKQPEVWKDISAAYDRFFERNPDAVGWHHNYAYYAYKCEQWDALNEQLKLLGDINYSYFGGEQEFDKMVEQAKQHATSNARK